MGSQQLSSLIYVAIIVYSIQRGAPFKMSKNDTCNVGAATELPTYLTNYSHITIQVRINWNEVGSQLYHCHHHYLQDVSQFP